jgi:hypothetical protein
MPSRGKSALGLADGELNQGDLMPLYSRSRTINQKPCGESFRISAPEVPVPMCSDLILSFLDNLSQLAQLDRHRNTVGLTCAT